MSGFIVISDTACSNSIGLRLAFDLNLLLCQIEFHSADALGGEPQDIAVFLDVDTKDAEDPQQRHQPSAVGQDE